MGPTKFNRTTHRTRTQAAGPLAVEERLQSAVPARQSLVQDREKSAQEKSVTYLCLWCFHDYLEKSLVLW